MPAQPPEALVATLVSLHGEEAAPTAEQWGRFLADDDGGPVQMVYLVQFRDQAAYPPGHDLTPRTGAEAFFTAGRVLAEVIRDVGGEPLLGGFPTSQMVDADRRTATAHGTTSERPATPSRTPS